jgi:hypothetical protein
MREIMIDIEHDTAFWDAWNDDMDEAETDEDCHLLPASPQVLSRRELVFRSR